MISALLTLLVHIQKLNKIITKYTNIEHLERCGDMSRKYSVVNIDKIDNFRLSCAGENACKSVDFFSVQTYCNRSMILLLLLLTCHVTMLFPTRCGRVVNRRD